jgi:hypothetical protein
MKKLTASVAAIATVLSMAPMAFAQDTINKGTPSTTPQRGAGDFGAGAPGEGTRSNSGGVDGTAGRSAAPAPTVGNPGQQALPPSPGNR